MPNLLAAPRLQRHGSCPLLYSSAGCMAHFLPIFAERRTVNKTGDMDRLGVCDFHIHYFLATVLGATTHSMAVG